jgi:hypothetical protein
MLVGRAVAWGRAGVEFVVSDDHHGLVWQRSRVGPLKNLPRAFPINLKGLTSRFRRFGEPSIA